MMKKTLLSLSLLATMASANLAFADSLLDVYNLAKQNDPQILAAAAARDAGQEKIPQARSVLLPQLSANAGYTKKYSTEDGSQALAGQVFDAGKTDSDGTTKSWGLRLDQELYHHDSWIAMSQAEKSAEKSNLDYSAATQALIVRVAQTYFNVLAAQDNLEYARSNKEAIGRQLEQTKQRFNVGLIAITDVHEAQARYDQSVSDEIVAQNQLDNANEALREITARYHDKLSGLSGDIPLASPAPASVDDWIRFSEDQNPTLNGQKLQAEIAREEVDRRFAGHLPSLDLYATYSDSKSDGSQKSPNSTTGQRETVDFNNNGTSTTVGVTFTVPLFSGGRTNSQVREGESLYTQAKQLLEQEHRAVIKDTKSAYLGVMASISAVKALKQSVISSQSALEATQAGFEVGTRTIVDVLNSTQAVYLAKRNLAQARYDYLLNGLKLKQAGGILKEADLAAVNALLR